jgi:chemotaxis response regulator CheB
MPRLLMGAVAAILDQAPDVVVVARLDDAADVATVVSTLQPDVVVLQESGAPGLGSHDALFAARDGLRVVAISDTGADGVLYRKGTRPALLPRLSAVKLVRTVRGTPPVRPTSGRPI